MKYEDIIYSEDQKDRLTYRLRMICLLLLHCEKVHPKMKQRIEEIEKIINNIQGVKNLKY